jgi:HSP20 family protein
MAMSILPWEPRRDLLSMRDLFDRAYEDWFYRPLTRTFDSTLAVDMYESDGHIVLKTPMPGVKPEDIDISVTGDCLTIKGETKEESEVEDVNYIRHERHMGTYYRSITLPDGVETDNVEADYHDGILTLEFPKSEEAMTKNIKIKA